MGLLNRIGNILRGKANKAVQELESHNVDALIASIEEDIEEHRRKAEEQIVAILTSSEKAKMQLKKAEKDLAAIRARKQSAIKAQDEKLLVDIIMMEKEAQNTYDSLKKECDIIDANLKNIKEQHEIFESEMRAKQRELNSMQAQAKMAELKEDMNTLNAQYAGNSSAAELKHDLDRVRDIVEDKIAKANAMETFHNESVDVKLKRLEVDSAREEALEEARKLLGKE